MRSVLDGLHSQRLYYLATEKGLELLARMAKRSPLVRQWLFGHRAEWAWAAAWLEANPRAPSYYNMYGTQAVRSPPPPLATAGVLGHPAGGGALFVCLFVCLFVLLLRSTR